MFKSYLNPSRPQRCLKAFILFLAVLCFIVTPENTLTIATAAVLNSTPDKSGHATSLGQNTVRQAVYRKGITKTVYATTVNQSVYAKKPPASIKPKVQGPPVLNLKDPTVIKTIQLARSVRKRMAYRVSRGGRYRRVNYVKNPNVELKKYRNVRVLASAYSPRDRGVGKYTFSEIKVQPNVIAVDPRVIPLGSIVYVPGYGIAVAADTGSAIKGYRIDLFMQNRKQALNWGKKYIGIYIYN